MISARRGAVWLCGLVSAAVGPPAALAAPDEAPARRTIVVEKVRSRCPDANAIVEAVRARLPEWEVHAGRARRGEVKVRLADHGSIYELTVGPRRLRFREDNRRCPARAKNVADAVYVILMLKAPEPPPEPAPAEPIALPGEPARPVVVAPPTPPAVAATPAPRAPEPPPPPIPPIPPPPPPRDLALELEVAGLGGFALRDDRRLVGFGGAAVRLTLGRRAIAATLGVDATSPVALTVATPADGTIDVTLQRVPIDLGARLTLERGRVRIAGEAGLALSLLVVEGVVLAEAGARVGALFGLRVHPRWTVSLGAHVLVPFVPTEIRVEREGASGNTVLASGTGPPLLFGATLGVIARLW